MNYPTSRQFEEILTYGKFYNPGNLHYSKPNTIVNCDKCRKNNISMCIGYNDLDLCLKCASEIEDIYRRDLNPVYLDNIGEPKLQAQMEISIFDARDNKNYNHSTT